MAKCKKKLVKAGPMLFRIYPFDVYCEDCYKEQVVVLSQRTFNCNKAKIRSSCVYCNTRFIGSYVKEN